MVLLLSALALAADPPRWSLTGGQTLHYLETVELRTVATVDGVRVVDRYERFEVEHRHVVDSVNEHGVAAVTGGVVAARLRHLDLASGLDILLDTAAPPREGEGLEASLDAALRAGPGRVGGSRLHPDGFVEGGGLPWAWRFPEGGGGPSWSLTLSVSGAADAPEDVRVDARALGPDVVGDQPCLVVEERRTRADAASEEQARGCFAPDGRPLQASRTSRARLTPDAGEASLEVRVTLTALADAAAPPWTLQTPTPAPPARSAPDRLGASVPGLPEGIVDLEVGSAGVLIGGGHALALLDARTLVARETWTDLPGEVVSVALAPDGTPAAALRLPQGGAVWLGFASEPALVLSDQRPTLLRGGDPLILALEDGTVCRVPLATRRLLCAPVFPEAPLDLAYDPLSGWIAATSGAELAFVDYENGRVGERRALETPASVLAWDDAGGLWLAVTGRVDRLARKRRPALRDAGEVRALAVAPGGLGAVTRDADGVLVGWTGKRRLAEAWRFEAGGDGPLAWVDDRVLRVDRSGATLRVLDARSGVPLDPIAGHATTLVGVAVAADGRVLSLDRDGVLLEHGASSSLRRDTTPGDRWTVLATDGDAVVLGGAEGLWRATPGEGLAPWQPLDQAPLALAFGGGRALAVDARGARVSGPDGAALATWEGPVCAGALSADGRRALVVDDSRARVFSVDDGALLAERPAHAACAAALSADGATLAVRSPAGRNLVEVLGVGDGAPLGLAVLPVEALDPEHTPLALSADGARLAVGVRGAAWVFEVDAIGAPSLPAGLPDAPPPPLARPAVVVDADGGALRSLAWGQQGEILVALPAQGTRPLRWLVPGAGTR